VYISNKKNRLKERDTGRKNESSGGKIHAKLRTFGGKTLSAVPRANLPRKTRQEGGKISCRHKEESGRKKETHEPSDERGAWSEKELPSIGSD